jgi:hypothetical protein
LSLFLFSLARWVSLHSSSFCAAWSVPFVLPPTSVPLRSPHPPPRLPPLHMIMKDVNGCRAPITRLVVALRFPVAPPSRPGKQFGKGAGGSATKAALSVPAFARALQASCRASRGSRHAACPGYARANMCGPPARDQSSPPCSPCPLLGQTKTRPPAPYVPRAGHSSERTRSARNPPAGQSKRAARQRVHSSSSPPCLTRIDPACS